ncbi:hypothetical protein ACJ41O_004686 [Fusarium nematophilum]
MADAKKEPTAAEAMLFFSIVKHTRNKADVDWEAVAQEAGFKNADVAKVRFGQVKRKLGISTDPNGPTTPTKKTPGSGSKVAKTPRSKGKSRSKVKKEEQPENEDEDHKMELPPIVKGEQAGEDELAPDFGHALPDPF